MPNPYKPGINLPRVPSRQGRKVEVREEAGCRTEERAEEQGEIMICNTLSFMVNVVGCRYNVRPCLASEPEAERVLRSEVGLLLTDKHELRNLFVPETDWEFAVVTEIN